MKIQIKNTSSIKILAVSLVVAILAGGTYGYFYWQLRTKSINVTELQGEIELANKKTQRLQSIEQSFEELEGQVDTIQGLFVGAGNEGAVEFIGELESLASASGVTLNTKSLTLTPTKNQNQSNLVELLQVEIDASGSWTDVFTFVSGIENMPYKIELSKVNLGKGSVSPGDAVASSWSTSLSLSVLKLK